MKTTDFTPFQEKTLANLNTQTGVKNNLIGGNPTSTRFDGFAPRVGITSTMPNANVTGLNSNITGGTPPNDYDTGNLGINNNDYNMGNPGQYATADMINEFGDGRMGNINDEFGYSDNFNAGLVNEFGQSPEFNAGLVNEFAENNVLAGNADQGFVNDPYGTSDQGFVNNPYGTSDQGFQGIGETIASLTNSGLPGNNQFAEVTQMDLDRKNQFGMLDYDTAKDIGMISPNLTQEEFEGIKSGAITAVG